jgi:hypothetical protein
MTTCELIACIFPEVVPLNFPAVILFVMPTAAVTVDVPAAAYLHSTAYVLWENPWEEM